MTIKNKKLFYTCITTIMSLIFIYAGLFLFNSDNKSKNVPEKIQNGQRRNFPVEHDSFSTVINGQKQKINVLKINVTDERVKIKPVLSYNSLFGFDKLSHMSTSVGAYAAINAGFFYEYGQPSGLVLIDGILLKKSTENYPSLIIDNRAAYLKQIEQNIWIDANGKKIDIDDINAPGKTGGAMIYTKEYGNSNRITEANVTVTVENNKVKKIEALKTEAQIAQTGFIITFLGTDNKKFLDSNLSIGDAITFQSTPPLSTKAQGYECGSWILKNRAIVVPDKDEWVGLLTNRDPRSVVGVKGNKEVYLITIDGRQPEYSVGVTGKELAEFLLNLGIDDAAMLDGGASTEMIVRGKMVNRPCYKGEERPLGGGLVVSVAGSW